MDLKKSIDGFYDAFICEGIIREDEENPPEIDGEDYRDYMAWILFIDAFASTIESDYPDLEGEIHGELTQTVPDFISEKGFDIDTFVDSRLGYEIVKAYNEHWAGKLTVAELVEFDENAAYNLAMVAVGHGVSPEDDPETAKFMKERGVSSSSGPSFESPYDSAYNAIDKMDLGPEDAGDESIEEGDDVQMKKDKAKHALGLLQDVEDLFGKVEPDVLSQLEQVVQRIKGKEAKESIDEKEEPASKSPKATGDIGPDRVIGKTRSGKDIWLYVANPAHRDFTRQDHIDASHAQKKQWDDLDGTGVPEKTMNYYRDASIAHQKLSTKSKE